MNMNFEVTTLADGVGQAYQPAGSPGLPARCSLRKNWRLVSRQHRQAGKPALHFLNPCAL